MDVKQNNYVQYQGLTNTVATGISRIDDVCQALRMNTQSEELKKLSERMNNHVFSVGIMGEFKRGKSTLINGLLGQEILPADPRPCSATLNYVRWDSEKRAEIIFKDGTVRRVPFEELSKYVTKITAENAGTADNVDYAAVYCPCLFCQNGVQIVDTPGLNDDERMTEISEKVVPSLDAIIMIIHAGSPFGMSEASFIREKVMASDLGRIIFVVNFIDMIDEDERPALLEAIREKIKDSVLDKMEKVYGKGSEEYLGALNMVRDINIVPVSAKKALKGKIKGDSMMYTSSGYPAFEDVLSNLLTNERGMLELVPPVKKINSTAKEAAELIEMRRNALAMSAEEFSKVQEESKKQIKDAREKKKEQIGTLKIKGKNLYIDLYEEVNEEYSNIENELRDYVESITITEENIKNKESLAVFSEKISSDLGAKLKEAASISTERLTVKIQDKLGKDIEGLYSLSESINNTLKDIQVNISQKSNGNSANSFKNTTISTLVDAGVVIGTSFGTGLAIPGVGGLISGYRNGGIKGAAVGGLTGAAAGLAVASFLAPLGVVGIPLALIIGATSTFAGGGLAKLIFGKGKAENDEAKKEKVIAATKNSLRDAVDSMVNNLKDNSFLENWLKESCEKIYEYVAEDIDREWEDSLASMEESLRQIEQDLTKNEVMKTEKEKELAALDEKIVSIIDDMKPVYDKITKAIG